MQASCNPNAEASTLDTSRRDDLTEWIFTGAPEGDPLGDPLYDRIMELKQMPEGWDGESARQIRSEIIQTAWDFAIGIVNDNLFPYVIVPLTNGTLELEWSKGDRILQFEFENSETVHYLKWDSGAKIQEEGFFASDDMAKARSLLHWFASQA